MKYGRPWDLQLIHASISTLRIRNTAISIQKIQNSLSERGPPSYRIPNRRKISNVAVSSALATNPPTKLAMSVGECFVSDVHLCRGILHRNVSIKKTAFSVESTVKASLGESVIGANVSASPRKAAVVIKKPIMPAGMYASTVNLGGGCRISRFRSLGGASLEGLLGGT